MVYLGDIIVDCFVDCIEVNMMFSFYLFFISLLASLVVLGV